MPGGSRGQHVFIRSGDLYSPKGNQRIHRPDKSERFLQVEAGLGRRQRRGTYSSKGSSIPGFRKLREMVEGIEGKNERNGNLEGQLGYYQLKTMGGKEKTSG